jgi:transcription initiation factor TFIIIB Brf1 subunit/transcription initiation factor TFIIB
MVGCPNCHEDDDLSATVRADGRREIVCGRCGHLWVRGEAARDHAASPAAAGSSDDAPRSGRAASVNERAVGAVVDELARRGAACRVSRERTRREVLVNGNVRGREVVLVVRGRTSGDWQTRASHGQPREPERMPYRFWVFVDLLPTGPEFYIEPEWVVQSDIHRTHSAYLESHAGTRPRNSASDHHRIETERVAGGRDRWDLLRIFH